MNETSTTTHRSSTSATDVVPDWIALWNDDLTVAEALVADDFRLHASRLDGRADASGPDALLTFVESTRAAMPDLRFEIELGPFVDGDTVILRWLATGHYASGFPGATAPAGTPVRFTGIDILRVDGGRVAEYWLNADVHVLLGQVGVLGG